MTLSQFEERSTTEFHRTPGPSPPHTEVFSELPQGAGIGHAIAHHGEIYQGALHRDGEVVECLITMPSPHFNSWAMFIPTETDEVVSKTASKDKARQAAEDALSFLHEKYDDIECPGGELYIESNNRIGFGNGSSTTDSSASVKAVGNALGHKIGDEDIASIVVNAEGASDSTMLDHRHIPLFAQHEGEVLENFAGTFPDMLVVAGYADSEPVETDGIDREFSPSLLNEHKSLRSKLRQGINKQRPELVGEVAQRSLLLSQQFCPTPNYQRLRDIGDHYDVLGLGGSHSGTAIYYLLHVDRVHTANRLMESLEEEGFGPTYQFTTLDAVV